MSLETALQEDRRGLILGMLAEAGSYRLADASIKSILDRFAHRISTDQVRGDLAWLEGQGLVRIDKEGPSWMVQLLEPGQDVAHGVSHPGVRRQAPRR